MLYAKKSAGSATEILLNDHYAAIPYDCTEVTAANGVIPAGTILPANDATARGVLLNDVYPAENPNGTLVIHGFIRKDRLPALPGEGVDLPMLWFQ